MTSTSDQMPTLAALLDRQAAANPDAIAFWQENETVTYAALQRQSLRLAHGLRKTGLVRGSKIALWLPNRPGWLIWLFAAARIGATIVAVNTRFRSAEVEDILTRTAPAMLVLEPGFKNIDFAEILAGIAAKAKSGLQAIVATGCGSPSGSEMVPESNFISSDTNPFNDGRPDDPIILFTTSGTTSKPKFVVHQQRSLTLHAEQVSNALGYADPGTVLLQALPLCGTFGLAQALAGLAGGCPSVLMSAFEAGQAVDLIRNKKVTSFNGADQMFEQIIVAARPGDLASITWCGFAAFNTPDIVAFVEKCEAAGLVMAGLYGMSETQALFARQPLGLQLGERALAGGALLSPDARAQARDPETGKILATGQSGELYLSGPSRFSEYYGNDAATKAAIGTDGFVRTGDLGYISPDGRMIFEARMGDSLRLGGFLVNPAEIDTAIQGYPGITACQTVAVDTKNGLRAISFIIASGAEIDTIDLLAFCKKTMAGFKIPIAIFQVQSYPTSLGANGEKIQRGKLREMAREKLQTI